MIHGSAIHIAYRILAAFFIDMGAKTSIVENLVLSTETNRETGMNLRRS
jgi:hypothetical protein